MGMIKIQMYGSFDMKNFQTCAEEGGHVQVIKDAKLTADGIAPPSAPLGTDLR